MSTPAAPSIAAWKANAAAALQADLAVDQAAITDAQASTAAAILAQVLTDAAPLIGAAVSASGAGPVVGALVTAGANATAASLNSGTTGPLNTADQAVVTAAAAAATAALAKKGS